MTRRAAVVFQTDGRLQYLPAEVVRRIINRPVISPVPASELGLSFVQGRVAATVELGSGPHALVCEHATDTVTLSGVIVQQVGFFDIEADCLLWQGDRVQGLDVASCLTAALNSRTSGAAE